MNAERLNRGLPPLGANGQPIMPQAAGAQPEPQQSDPATEAFFRGATDFERRPDPAYASIPVKRFNK